MPSLSVEASYASFRCSRGYSRVKEQNTNSSKVLKGNKRRDAHRVLAGK